MKNSYIRCATELAIRFILDNRTVKQGGLAELLGFKVSGSKDSLTVKIGKLIFTSIVIERNKELITINRLKGDIGWYPKKVNKLIEEEYGRYHIKKFINEASEIIVASVNCEAVMKKLSTL